MDANNNKRIFGVYQTEADAQRAIDDLLNMGYTKDHISILSKSSEIIEMDDQETSTEAGLKGGAATGATIGGVGGLLAGLGLLVIPGIGPLLAAGPIAAAFAGAITGGAIGGTIGTIGGAMMDAGVEEADARYLEDRFSAGDIIVYVDAPLEQVNQVVDRLDYHNWRTEAEFDAYNQKLIERNPAYPDSDIHHDNMDLDLDDEKALPVEPVSSKEPPDNCKPVAAPRSEPVYTDSDMRHDNMDLDLEAGALNPIDPMRITDPTDPDYRKGATFSEHYTGNYRQSVNSGEAITGSDENQGLRGRFDHAKDRAEYFITGRRHEIEKETMAPETNLDNASEQIIEAKHKADLRIDELTNHKEE